MELASAGPASAVPPKRRRLSELNRRRLRNFRANRRGYWSFWIFLVLFVVSLGSELIASDRPIVVSSRSRIEIKLIERYDTDAQVACDGVLLGAMKPDVDVLDIEAAKERITLLHPPDHDYYCLLRSKLHWRRGGLDPSR